MPTMSTQLLEALYDAHAKAIYWAAYGVLRDKDAAADAMQNAFLSAHRNIDMLAGIAPAQQRAWLYRCAVNGSIDILRRNKRNVPTEDAGLLEADPAPGPEAEAERNETQRLVRDALAALPEKYRQPLYLYYFAELDYHEIAALLNINEGTLKSQMSRGRSMMEKLLKKGDGVYAQKQPY